MINFAEPGSADRCHVLWGAPRWPMESRPRGGIKFQVDHRNSTRLNHTRRRDGKDEGFSGWDFFLQDFIGLPRGFGPLVGCWPLLFRSLMKDYLFRG